MIIVIANQKGGVGKTTTAINLSAACALKGKRVLLIDLDPQGNSSLSFIHSEEINGSAFELLTELEQPWANFIHKTKVEKLDIVPSKISLAKVEAKLVGDFDAIFRLRDRIENIRKDYDLIFFDTPPTLGIITVNALVAATHVLIPIQSSYFALEGTDDLLETIEKIKVRANPQLQILGALITMYDKRTTLAKDIYEQIQQVFGNKVFETVITKSVRLEESPAYRESIFTFAPRSTGAYEYYRLSEEVLSRV